jgi:uncharacterized membrane protein YtjA (UPF0391 family)
MLYWTLIFLVIALVAGVLGFSGIASAASGIAKILFVIFLVLFLVSLDHGPRMGLWLSAFRVVEQKRRLPQGSRLFRGWTKKERLGEGTPPRPPLLL